MNQLKGPEKGPTITIIGGMHGNEKTGVKVIKKLLKMNLKLKMGTLNLIIGNPAACKANKRFIEIDANRCFDDKNPKTNEGKRIKIISKYLDKSDLMIDIHSTLKPAPAFLVIPNLKHKFSNCISQLGIKTIISGEGLKHPSGKSIESDLYTCSKGGLGITIESGTLNHNQISKKIIKVLEQLNMLEKDLSKLQIHNVYSQILAGQKFKFSKEWNNFEKISKGETYAYNGKSALKVNQDSKILFPKSKQNIVTGQQACLLINN